VVGVGVDVWDGLSWNPARHPESLPFISLRVLPSSNLKLLLALLRLVLQQNLADISLEYGVQTFVYSSANRMGPKYEDTLELSHKAKRNVENHCKQLGKKGLNWTLVI
jgi:hypothetical protein